MAKYRHEKEEEEHATAALAETGASNASMMATSPVVGGSARRPSRFDDGGAFGGLLRSSHELETEMQNQIRDHSSGAEGDLSADETGEEPHVARSDNGSTIGADGDNDEMWTPETGGASAGPLEGQSRAPRPAKPLGADKTGKKRVEDIEKRR